MAGAERSCPGCERLRIPGHAALRPGHPAVSREAITRQFRGWPGQSDACPPVENACESQGTLRFAPATPQTSGKLLLANSLGGLGRAMRARLANACEFWGMLRLARPP